jgi:FMN-dependent NADH-azoreductase
MPVLLHIDSSISGAASRTRAITGVFAERWRALGESFTVVHRDVGADPIPHLPDAALHWPERLRPQGATPPAEAAALQQALIDELLGADVLLVGAPMYNYSLPSGLKAWLDHVHVPGVTTPFDVPSQPLAGRAAVIVTSRGASYDPGTDTATFDHTVPPLEIVLGTAFGMSVEVITASLALAETVPALADQRDRAAREFADAQARAAELAETLGAPLA